MPENTVAKAHRDSSLTSKSKWVTPVIIVLVVGLFIISMVLGAKKTSGCLLYTSPSPRDATLSRMPSSA